MPANPWTTEEINTLQTEYKNHTAEEIQAQFMPYRSLYSIRMALHRYEISERKKESPHAAEYKDSNMPWTPQEDEILRKYFPIYSTQAIQKNYLPNRSTKGVERRAYRLGLQRDNEYAKRSKNRNRSKTKPYAIWTQDELDLLVKHYPSMSAEELHSKYLPGKTPEQIYTKARNENISRESPAWTEAELKTLQENAEQLTTKQLMQLLPNRTAPSIQQRSQMLGLKIGSKPAPDAIGEISSAWTPREDEILKQYHNTIPVHEIHAKYLNHRTLRGVKSRIRLLQRDGQLQKKNRPRKTKKKTATNDHS